jgi:hypothetical protein
MSVGRSPGGINNSGGWVLKWGCDHVFPVNVKNPDDASRVHSGATILARSGARRGCSSGSELVGQRAAVVMRLVHSAKLGLKPEDRELLNESHI